MVMVRTIWLSVSRLSETAALPESCMRARDWLRLFKNSFIGKFQRSSQHVIDLILLHAGLHTTLHLSGKDIHSHFTGDISGAGTSHTVANNG